MSPLHPRTFVQIIRLAFCGFVILFLATLLTSESARGLCDGIKCSPVKDRFDWGPRNPPPVTYDHFSTEKVFWRRECWDWPDGFRVCVRTPINE